MTTESGTLLTIPLCLRLQRLVGDHDIVKDVAELERELSAANARADEGWKLALQEQTKGIAAERSLAEVRRQLKDWRDGDSADHYNRLRDIDAAIQAEKE